MSTSTGRLTSNGNEGSDLRTTAMVDTRYYHRDDSEYHQGKERVS